MVQWNTFRQPFTSILPMDTPLHPTPPPLVLMWVCYWTVQREDTERRRRLARHIATQILWKQTTWCMAWPSEFKCIFSQECALWRLLMGFKTIDCEATEATEQHSRMWHSWRTNVSPNVHTQTQPTYIFVGSSEIIFPIYFIFVDRRNYKNSFKDFRRLSKHGSIFFEIRVNHWETHTWRRRIYKDAFRG